MRNTLNLFVFLGTFLSATISSATAIAGSTASAYDPLACPDRHVRTLPREPSSRTDLQLRDTRTELSNIVFRRGFFSWAKSLLKRMYLGVGSEGDKHTGCDVLRPGRHYHVDWHQRVYQAKVAASLATATSNANFELVDVTRSWAQAGTQTDLVRRAKNPTFKFDDPWCRHHASGKPVTLWDVARANSTHPITVLHNHPAFKATIRMPSMSGRAALPSGCISLGEVKDCTRPGSTVPPNAPATMYYGFDVHGTKAQIQEFQADLGTTYDKKNGFEPALVDMAKDIVARQAWDTCVCEKTQNTWISTGSIQMSWDNTYNGYSPCWKPNCDNDAMVPVVN
ncbi:hypothetical protein B0H13DRAFT_2285197 [Mycena leptocephala]|nr:hypothetical protein B0H13DRAFT_2285197 [Mycena leptocephala]